MTALDWDDIKQIRPNDPVVIVEPRTTKVRVGAGDKARMVPMNRADRRRGRRGGRGDFNVATGSPTASKWNDSERISVAARRARRAAAIPSEDRS